MIKIFYGLLGLGMTFNISEELTTSFGSYICDHADSCDFYCEWTQCCHLSPESAENACLFNPDNYQ